MIPIQVQLKKRALSLKARVIAEVTRRICDHCRASASRRRWLRTIAMDGTIV